MAQHYQYENIPGVHPFIGFVITFSVFMCGVFLPQISFIVLQYHLPPIVIELGQLMAYCGTATVGIIAAYKFYKESIKPKFKRKNDDSKN
jgi:hypothetical protein